MSWVLLAVIRGIKRVPFLLKKLKRSFREQFYCLLLEGVDGLLLETFYDLEELETVLDDCKEGNETSSYRTSFTSGAWYPARPNAH